MKFTGNTNEYFEILNIDSSNIDLVNKQEDGVLSMLWFTEDNNTVLIDTVEHTFNKNQIVFFTQFNNRLAKQIQSAKFLKFNTPFYCILDHDSEVSCKGILFYGSSNIPILNPNEEDINILSTVWQMAINEFKSADSLQLEMLQMMLKRILILCTRIYQAQDNFSEIDKGQVDIVREFNYLVEQHFKTKHTVSEYAELLNKSPKTISNIFGKLKSKSPLQIIQNRIMLEVRRMLRHTDKPISEIGYEVGFNDVQSFSRFFKKNEGIPPTEFRSS